MTWKHVAVFAIASVVVLACELTASCQVALPLVMGFAGTMVGAAAGNAMRSEDASRRDKAP